MRDIMEKNSLLLLSLLFVLITMFRIIHIYYDLSAKEESSARKESDALSALMSADGRLYQELFIERHVLRDINMTQAAPTYSPMDVSGVFGREDGLDIAMRTASDRPRDAKYKADADELAVIEHFRKDPDLAFSLKKSEDHYQYFFAVRMDKRCQVCHGSRENVPALIQEHSDQGYDYKIGEAMGVISIKSPREETNGSLLSTLADRILFDLSLLSILFVVVFIMVRRSRAMNVMLKTEVKKKTEELQGMLAMHPLTGLPNRNMLIRTLDAFDGLGHLALLNIDSFKEINDFYGHLIADRLLVMLSDAIQSRCTDRMRLFKMPADEYAIFTDQSIAHSDFVKSMKAMLEHLNTERFIIDEIEINVTFGCGIAFGTDSLLIKADIALQRAKRDRRALVVYSEEINTAQDVDRNINAMAILKSAIEEDRIIPYFQPIYNLHTNMIEKYEVLARVVVSDGTVLAPNSFMEVAERSKLYPYITMMMIEKSFAKFRSNRYEFSVNLSIRDVLNVKTVNFIREQLAQFADCERIVFEILEGDKIENYAILKSFIEMVKGYGVKIAIDDFGSGYSNFSHIMELDVDYIKIDASLIREVTTSENSQIIVQGIIDFSKRLGLKTIGEYVESKEILEMLRSMDVDLVQGYHIGRPSPDLQERRKD